MKRKIDRTSLMWSFHNIVAHPVSEFFYLASFLLELCGFTKIADKAEKAGNWVHDATIPAHSPGEGRG